MSAITVSAASAGPVAASAGSGTASAGPGTASAAEAAAKPATAAGEPGPSGKPNVVAGRVRSRGGCGLGRRSAGRRLGRGGRGSGSAFFPPSQDDKDNHNGDDHKQPNEHAAVILFFGFHDLSVQVFIMGFVVVDERRINSQGARILLLFREVGFQHLIQHQ